MANKDKVVLLNPITIKVECQFCHTEHEITVDKDDAVEYLGGGLIQRCFPYLSPGERELLISHTCSVCWDKMFAECK